MEDSAIKDSSPYPSQSDMDLDMWRASKPSVIGFRAINSPVGTIASVPPHPSTTDRDVMARRIEGMGDLYEALRRAAERMIEAGIDVSDEHRALTEFVSPKPFAEGC